LLGFPFEDQPFQVEPQVRPDERDGKDGAALPEHGQGFVGEVDMPVLENP
jgi:hypothetical protein